MISIEQWTTLEAHGFAVLRVLLAVLWQSSILFFAIAAVAWLLRKRRASARHAVWLAALMVAPLLPLLASLVTWTGAPQAPVSMMPAYETPVRSVAPAEIGAPAAPAPPVIMIPEQLVEAVPPAETPRVNPLDYPWALAMLGYYSGLLVFMFWFCAGHARIFRWRYSVVRCSDARVRPAFAFAQKRLGVSQPIRVFECDRVPAPVTVGVFRHAVLIPRRVAEGLSETELRAIAIHEMAHVKRRDPLVFTLVALVRAVLFFHPLVWLAARQINVLAEHAADDAVLDASIEPISYAELLTRIAENLPRHTPAPDFAAGIVLSKSTFLRRVEAILSERRDQIRKLTRLALAGTVLAGLISLGIVLALPLVEDRSYHVTGDDLPIELIGIRPDGGDAIFDPEGNPIDLPPDSGFWDASREHTVWGEDETRHDFIFNLPVTEEPVEYLSLLIRPDNGPEDRWVWSRRFHPMFHWRGGQTRLYPYTFKTRYRDSIGPIPIDQELGHADVVIRYYHGSRGAPDAVFRGSFSKTGTVFSEGAGDYRLTYDDPRRYDPTTYDAAIKISTEHTLNGLMPLSAYDMEGNWVLAQYGGGSYGSVTNTAQYRIPGLRLEEISKLAFNEQPKTKIFHHVRIQYPDLPERHHSPQLDVLAERLGLDPSDPESVRDYKFQSPHEALKVLNIIPPTQAWRVFRSSDKKPDEFTSEELNSIRKAIRPWAKSPNPWDRIKAIEFGLGWGKWPEFIDPALELVGEDVRESSEAARLLHNNTAILTLEQLDRIKQLALKMDSRHASRYLTGTFMMTRVGPHAAATRGHLADLARSDKPWVWWPIIREHHTWKVLLEDGRVTRNLQVRRAMVAGVPEPDTEALNPAAKDGLAEILTPQFHAISPDRFRVALRNYTRLATPQEGTPVLVKLMRRTLEEWNDYELEWKSSLRYQLVGRSVQTINHWNGTNIGTLGEDVNAYLSDGGFDWKAIAQQAVAWHESGIDPAMLPEGWTPGNGDMRIVWRNNLNQELSVITVWALNHADGAWTPMKLTDESLNFHITATPGQAGQYRMETRLGVKNSHANYQEVGLRWSELPTEPALRDYWVAAWDVRVERADAQQSLLSGTNLFQAWKEHYLTTGGLSKTRPKVFFDHPREVVKQYLMNRRPPSTGWTEAEIALQHALDTDPHSLAERPFQDDFTPEHALSTWRAFLERDDLIPAMEVHALGRVAYWSKARYSELDPRQNPDDARVEALREEVRRACERIFAIEGNRIN